MFVSVEVIAMIACAVSVVVAFVSACGWFLNRMDARFALQDSKFDARFDRVEDRMSGVEHELSEVKISVARLEGPQRGLISAR